jgi:hypothetical protein
MQGQKETMYSVCVIAAVFMDVIKVSQLCALNQERSAYVGSRRAN